MDSLRASLICIAYAALTSAQQATISLAPPSNAGTFGNVSQIISPSFAGMGIEPSNLFSFTGRSRPNQLSINLLQNLAGYTGSPPHLRIGGNTADYMIWQGSWNDWTLPVNQNPVGQGQIASDLLFFGPKYFQAMDRFPTNTPITFGLNLAYDNADYMVNIVNEASACLNYTSNVNIFSFEIGNEPDLYLQNGFRNGTWNNFVYAQQWTDRADVVYEEVLRPMGIGSSFFEAAGTASTIGNSFEILQLSETIMATPVNGTAAINDTFLVGWNQHDYFYYIGVSGYALDLDFLMDLSQTPTQFAAWADNTRQAYRTGKPYYLREMASVGPIGLTGISDVFGATLWQLNFFLYTATLNITNVNMHMTDNSFAAPWQPINNYGVGPYVRTTYYAWAAMTQIIGRGCAARVAPLTVAFPANYANRIAAYAAYQNDRLSSITVINTLLANATQPKGSVSVTVSLPDFAGQTLYISELTADGADSRFNTTWNGLSYEQSGTGLPSVVNSTIPTVQVGSDGTATFSVRDSQAVVANIGMQIGTGGTPSYASASCGALVSSQAILAQALPTAGPGAPMYAISTTSVPPVTTVVGADANGATAPASATTGVRSPSSSSSGAGVPAATVMPKAALVGMAALAGGMAVFA